MHVKFHFIMLFTFNSYILSETIVSKIHVPYNQNLMEILQTFPQQHAGHHLVSIKVPPAAEYKRFLEAKFNPT